jgi:D-aminoacyl-tRNA deacylase
MRTVVQRVSHASVTIDGKQKSSIGNGLLVLLGIGEDDTQEDIDYLVKKLVNMRIFDDSEGVMNLSVQDVGGDIMVISQFTLMASTRKGNRPSYIRAARHDISIPLYHDFIRTTEAVSGKKIATGEFGADMKVDLLNNGPVTIIMDSKQKEI